VGHRAGPAGPHGTARKPVGGLRGLARRNLVAAGAGALLVAVLGTVVTLGATSDNDPDNPAERVGVNPSASQGAGDDGLGAEKAGNSDGKGPGDTGTATSRPTDPGPDGTYGTSDDPTPTQSAEPSDDPSGTQGSGGGSSSPPAKPTPKPPSSTKPPTPTSKPPTTPTDEPTTTEPTDEPTTTEPTDEPTTTAPTTSNSASGPASSSAPASTSASAPQSDEPGTPSTSESVI
jgi:hypothetical protein